MILPEHLAEVEVHLKRVRADIELWKAPVDVKVAQHDIGNMVRASVENLLEVLQVDVLKGREVLQRHINKLVLFPVEDEGKLVYQVMGDIDLFRAPDKALKI